MPRDYRRKGRSVEPESLARGLFVAPAEAGLNPAGPAARPG